MVCSKSAGPTSKQHFKIADDPNIFALSSCTAAILDHCLGADWDAAQYGVTIGQLRQLSGTSITSCKGHCNTLQQVWHTMPTLRATGRSQPTTHQQQFMYMTARHFHVTMPQLWRGWGHEGAVPHFTQTAISRGIVAPCQDGWLGLLCSLVLRQDPWCNPNTCRNDWPWKKPLINLLKKSQRSMLKGDSKVLAFSITLLDFKHGWRRENGVLLALAGRTASFDAKLHHW
jgi:hypothetical protein